MKFKWLPTSSWKTDCPLLLPIFLKNQLKRFDDFKIILHLSPPPPPKKSKLHFLEFLNGAGVLIFNLPKFSEGQIEIITVYAHAKISKKCYHSSSHRCKLVLTLIFYLSNARIYCKNKWKKSTLVSKIRSDMKIFTNF